MLNKIMSCDKSFLSHIAYIISSFDKDSEKYPVTFDDYMKNSILQKQVENKEKYIVCSLYHELTTYISDIRKSHFRHKNYEPMSEWHKRFQSYCMDTEIVMGHRRADAMIGNHVLEFQHSPISMEEVEQRGMNYRKYGKHIHWIIDGNGSIVSNINENGTYTLLFTDDTWKYEHFITETYIFINIDDKMFRLDPARVKGNSIIVQEAKLIPEFINSFYSNPYLFWKDDLLTQCTLYVNQRGAGNGKTYEAVQLVSNDKRFITKNTFIYVSKMHSAREVIYKEFEEQYEEGKLTNLIKLEVNDSGKQYKISYTTLDQRDITVYIGTIDSFMYSLSHKNAIGHDFFNEIVKAIRNDINLSDTGTIQYAGDVIPLNKSTLLLVDEAQDLPVHYAEAIVSIMRKTYMDTFVIGDRLQSIFYTQNVMTYFLDQKSDTFENIHMECIMGNNIVRRFHHTQFMELVNKIVPFQQYELPSITGICPDMQCTYKHEEDRICYEKINIPDLFNKESEEKKDTYIDTIISTINIQTDTNGYVPEDFMFIFPIIKKNWFAHRLYEKIQNYWITKCNDKSYQENVLQKNSYWKIQSSDEMTFTKYVCLHFSEDGQPINFKESEHATRMVSIHASKGDGRPVVFVFGITESSLKIYSHGEKNLIYESLLHVAFTRQKKYLYIGLESKMDDIKKRFDFILSDHSPPSLHNITYCIKNSDISSFSLEDKELCSSIISILEKKRFEMEHSVKDVTVDWGHHMFRYATLWWTFITEVTNNEQYTDKTDQFREIMRKLSELEIVIKSDRDYILELRKISSKKIKHINTERIPLLELNNKKRYSRLLYNMMTHIQEKIKRTLKDGLLPQLCPIETLLVLHMMSIYDKGYYHSGISILQIYDIINCYEECIESLDENHRVCNCLCDQLNQSTTKSTYPLIRKSIKSHYEQVLHIKELYKYYRVILEKRFGTMKFKYMINPTIKKGDDNITCSATSTYTAYSNTHVIYINMVTSMNKLNEYDLLADSLFMSYFITHSDNKDKSGEARFEGKKITTCIIALDCEEPVFIDWEDHSELLLHCYEKYIRVKYSMYHQQLYDCYQYFLKNKEDRTKTSLSVMIAYINQKNDKGNLIYKIPKYMVTYVEGLDSQYNVLKDKTDEFSKEHKARIISILNSNELFLQELLPLLEHQLQLYKGNKNTEMIEDDI